MKVLFDNLAPNVGFMAANIKDEYSGIRGLNKLYRRLLAKQFTAVADFHGVLRTHYLRLRFNMGNFKVYRSFDEFLKDPNLSLRAKGFLTMVLTNNITTGFEVENYCTDTKEDIKDIILELRINHYLRYNEKDNTLEANAMPYEKWDKVKDSLDL